MNWHKEITDTMEANNDSWANVDECTLSLDKRHQEFDSDYGGTEGEPFTVWTTDYIYFPVCYDGSEWATSISRHPNGKATGHVGGG